MNNRNEQLDESLQKTSEMLTRMSEQSDSPPRPGFKEALKQRILDARHKQFMPSFSWLKAIPPKLAYGGTVALVAVIILMLVLNPFSKSIPVVYAQNNFTLTAEAEDSLGIDPTTSFLLESREPLDMDFVREYLQTDINRPFDLEKIDDYHARVSFKEKLSSGQMVKFLLPTQREQEDGTLLDRPYAWAFQVKDSFQILSSIPGKNTTDVPLDVGVEILFSHENVDEKDFEQAFSIQPAVKGHVEKNRRSMVFVPDQLEARTLYTVTINQSLHPSGSDETLEMDYTFQFETSDIENRYDRLTFSKNIITSIPSEKAQFQLNSYSYFSDSSKLFSDATFTLYRFPSKNQFQSSLTDYLSERWRVARAVDSYVPLSDLSVVSTFKPELMEQDYTTIAQMPFPLDEGYYGVLVEWNNTQSWAFMQSSSLSATIVEAQKNAGESLVWVHDTNTKRAVVGAHVRFDDEDITTNDRGLASIDLPEDVSMVEVQFADRTLFVPTTNNNYAYGGWGWFGSQVNTDEAYVGYLYSDRPVYKKNDQVHVWGFIEPRDGNSLPEQLALRITTNVYGFESWGQSNSVEYARLPVSVTKNGVFTGTLSLPDLTSGYYQLGLFDGEDQLVGRSIQVQEYRKPLYYMTFDVKEQAVIAQDDVHYDLRMNYFDGTPVAEKTVLLNPSGQPQQTVTLNAEGNVTGAIKVSADYASNGWVRAELDEPGFEPVFSTDSVHVYPSSVYLKGEGKMKNALATVEVDSRTVHITNADDRSEDVKTIRPGTQVTAVVTEEYYEKISDGKAYDFISKSTYEKFHFEYHSQVVDTQQLTTDANGKAVFSFATPHEESWYNVSVSAADDQSRRVEIPVYLWREDGGSASWYRYYGDDNGLHMVITDLEPDGNEKVEVQTQDQVHMQVQQFGGPFKMLDQGSFLFLQAQRGIQEYEVAEQPEYNFTFEEEDVPNIYVFGILFMGTGYVVVDGTSYWSMGKYLGFDSATRELTVDITTDAEQYRPGKEAAVTVRVNDVHGKPVEAEVNLSVVDEAFFAAFPDNPTPISSLYHSVSSGIKEIIVSHEKEAAALSAEGGGGGDGEVRSNFLDTAAFVSFTTNKKGEAQTKIALPDNVTSWRLTAQAIEPNLIQAGVAKKQIAATLPLFINAAIQPTYLTTDTPEVIVTTQGTGVKVGDPVEYQVEFSGETPSYKLSTYRVGDRAILPLGRLPEGKQTITIKATSGSYTDAISQEVDVVTSRLTTPVVETHLLDGSLLSGGSTGLTHVTFMDGNQGKFYGDLLRLSWQWGQRTDEAVVRSVASTMIQEMFDQTQSISDLDAGAFQDSFGGIRLLSFAEADPTLTAKVALLGETPFDEERLEAYLLNRLYAKDFDRPLTQEEAAWAYAGLASLGRPVLSELKRFEQQELSDDARLAGAIAHFASGDVEAARAVYQSLMKDAQREIGYVWVQRDTPETEMEMNAALYVLAAGFNEVDDRDGLKEYLLRQSSGQTVVVIETLLATKASLAFAKEGASEVEFTLRGQKQTIELKQGETKEIAVTPSELAELNARATRGDVMVVTGYQQPVSTLPKTFDKIGVVRNYLTDSTNPQGAQLSLGDTVIVELTYRIDPALPDEYYQITESIPSGLTPVSQYGGWEDYQNCIVNPGTDTDQTITFFVYQGWYGNHCPANTIRYRVRVMNAGEFTAEPAVIRAIKDPTLVNYSHEQTITITP